MLSHTVHTHHLILVRTQQLIQRAQADPAFVNELVQEILGLRTENESLKTQLSEAEQTHMAAQLALRQARGVSSYLRNNKHQMMATDNKAKEAMKKAVDMSHYLESKTVELEAKLGVATKTESQAQLALRQARGVTSYLKSKNENLEKKLAAANQAEQEAKLAWRKARDNNMLLRRSLVVEAERNETSFIVEGEEEKTASDGLYDDDNEEVMASEEAREEARGLGSLLSNKNAQAVVLADIEEESALSTSETIGILCLAAIAVSMIF